MFGGGVVAVKRRISRLERWGQVEKWTDCALWVQWFMRIRPSKMHQDVDRKTTKK